MKKFHKFVTTIFLICVMPFMSIPISATGKNIEFIDPTSGVKIGTQYNESEYTLKETLEYGTLWFSVHDEKGNEMEAWGFETNKIQTRAVNADWQHTHRKTIRGNQGTIVSTVSLVAEVTGSFRVFTDFNHHNVDMGPGGSPFSMNNHSKSAKPLNNIWPENVIYVSYTATIGRTLSYSQSLTIGADLLRAGFTQGSNYYFYATERASYSISV